jgi:hypothetical protein
MYITDDIRTQARAKLRQWFGGSDPASAAGE